MMLVMGEVGDDDFGDRSSSSHLKTHVGGTQGGGKKNKHDDLGKKGRIGHTVLEGLEFCAPRRTSSGGDQAHVVCMCACVHVCMCACVHVCMCACVVGREEIDLLPTPPLLCASSPPAPLR